MLTLLGAAGSHRSGINPISFMRLIEEAAASDRDIGIIVESVARTRIYSNSDIAVMIGLIAAKRQGLNIDVINLSNPPKNIVSVVDEASGIFIGSPVYFGDASHLIYDFINTIDLSNKVVGCTSTAAKRNGGQETTNIYILNAANNADAIVVGNGPATCQYGGTVHAGDIGAIRHDESGIRTTWDAGKKVVEIMQLLDAEYPLRKNIKLSCWIVSETYNSTVRNKIDTLIKFVSDHYYGCAISWEIIDFLKIDFAPCNACPHCPHNEQGCLIKHDDLAKNFTQMVDTDGILICGAANPDFDVFNKVLERTRCMRRDNFLLTNRPIMALETKQWNVNSLFSLKVLTSFVRHNTFILPPNGIANMIEIVRQIPSNFERPIYEPIGYRLKESQEK